MKNFADELSQISREKQGQQPIRTNNNDIFINDFLSKCKAAAYRGENKFSSVFYTFYLDFTYERREVYFITDYMYKNKFSGQYSFGMYEYCYSNAQMQEIMKYLRQKLIDSGFRNIQFTTTSEEKTAHRMVGGGDYWQLPVKQLYITVTW